VRVTDYSASGINSLPVIVYDKKRWTSDDEKRNGGSSGLVVAGGFAGR